eukprot:jgi/Botrbrau1/23310/Bobra.0102s0049.1
MTKKPRAGGKRHSPSTDSFHASSSKRARIPPTSAHEVSEHLDLLQSNPGGADLLITMAVAALKCDKKERRPLLVKDVPQKFVDESGTVDWSRLARTINKLPPIQDLLGLSKGPDLVRLLDSKDPQLSSCLEWILGSYHGQLLEVSDWRVHERARTRHVFVLKPSSAERSDAFEKREQEQGGSLFAFHASPLYNMHSILRSELKTATGTALQSYGGVFGKGLYLSEDMRTPRLHAEPSPGWSKSKFKAEVACVALCKAANKAVIREAGGVLRVEEEESVIVRCIFVYEGLTRPSGRVKMPESTTAASLGVLLEDTKEYRHLFN